MKFFSSESEPRILVIGASGTVGKELVQQLTEMHQKVRILVRDPARIPKVNNLVEPFIGDLDKPDTLLNAMRGIKRLFLITGSTQQDRNVLDVGKTTGLEQIVKLSTQEAGWVPVKGHGYWHHEREKLIKASGIPWTFLRPCMFMTTTTSWAYTIREKSIVTYPGGSGKIAPIDPWDVAAVAAVALIRT